ELDPLRLAARERVARLAELDIPETDLVEREQDGPELAEAVEERYRFVHAHIEDVRDVLAAIAHLERLTVVAPPLAHVAFDVHVGQKVHLDALDALALAGLAAPALDIEAESAGGVAAQLRLACARHQVANQSKRAGIRGRIA